tara:strand:- start:13 stop:1545 length:1533 start_codon:yes stop_codon:yes gene_type:complete
MSKCKNCEAPVEWNTRRNKPLMYCSKKCANDWHHKKNSVRRPGWGEGQKKALQERKERQEKYQWCCENWVSIKTLAEESGLDKCKVFYIAKVLNIKTEIANNRGANETFFRPEDADKIRIGLVGAPIPDGFLNNKEAAKHLGWALNTFKNKDRSNLPFEEFMPKSWSKKHKIKIYRPEDLEEWVSAREDEITKNKKLRIEANKKLRIERETHQKQEKEEKFRRETFGLIGVEKACEILGTKTMKHHRKKLAPKKINGKNWFDPKKVQQLAKDLEEFRNREKKKQYILRKISHTDPEAYEKRLFERKFPLWKSNTSKADSMMLNKKWHNNRVSLGLVKKLHCSKCNLDLPYYDFTYSNSHRGRQAHCRQCAKQRHINTYDPERPKKNRKENYVQRFRSIVGTQIKRDMSMVVGEYQDLMMEKIWTHIEKTLGYDAEALCEHLEAQFTVHMNWDNHLRSTKGFRWEMDHVIPRSKLKYDSLIHPNFAKCWDLSNLRPLEHTKNKTRTYGDKD